MFLVLLIPLLATSPVFGQVALSFGTPAAPKSFDPNCKDKLDTCWKMPESNCRDPYEDWAREYCGNRCGYCQGPTTPAPPCINKLPNCESYEKSVCTSPDYKTWASENCRYYCRMCSPDELLRLDSITTTISPADCVDKVDCRQYGQNACSKNFDAWSKDNCVNYCGYCKGIPTPPPTCVDKIPNCKAYNPDTCTNPEYKLWIADNCKKFCGLCPGSGSPSAAPPLPSRKDSPTISYVQPSPPSPGKRAQEPCEDTLDNCAMYGKTTCETAVYIPWAKVHCSRFCGFCVEGPELSRRQFSGSHHHQGGTHDCWDTSNDDPYCNTAAPNVQETTPSSSIQGSTGFPGSEYHPHEKPDSNWDSRPSTEAPKTTMPAATTPGVTQTSSMTATVKPPLATGHETPTMVSSRFTDVPTTTTASPTESTPSVTTTTVEPKSPSTEPSTTTTVLPNMSSTETTTQLDVSTPSSTKLAVKTPGGTATSASDGTTMSGTPPPLNTSAGTPPPLTTSAGTPPPLTASTATAAVNNSTSAAPAVVTSSPATTSSTPGTTPVPCVDTVDNCAMYGKTACESPVYRPWAKAHCSRFCGFCVAVTLTPFVCNDKLANCKEFDGGDLCTAESYFAWSRENCFAYCGFPPCGNNTGIKATTASTSLNTAPAIVAKSGSSDCSDKLNDCLDYPDAKCVGIYAPWARSHCAFRCGYCTDFLPCEDVNPDCDKFPAESCTVDSFKGWARKNCRKYCNLCARPTQNSAVTQPTGPTGSVNGTMPTPEIPFTSVDPVMMTTT